MNPEPMTFGAHASKQDYRNLMHDKVGAPQVKPVGGYKYPPSAILHQHKVGICTAISLVQNTLVATGNRYSEDFQYLLQKVYFDKNWEEGSSPLASLNIAKNYGMLPIRHLPSILQANPDLSYGQYVEKLMEIANDTTRMAGLLKLCEKPIKGFGFVNVNDNASFAQAIEDSKAGLICRFEVGNEWWTARDGRVTWSPVDLEPLRPPAQVVSGHQITTSDYEYNMLNEIIARVANTWGNTWCDEGSARYELKNYRPTEAWVPYFDFTPNYVPLPDAATWSHLFVRPIKLGDTGDEVKALQVKLMMEGCMPRITTDQWGIFGQKTRSGVMAFQLKRGIPMSFYEKYVLRGSLVGSKTLKALNVK